MQQLQSQSAQAHEKFLETQTQASKTLASMMEQTREFIYHIPASARMNAPIAVAPISESVSQAIVSERSHTQVQPAAILERTEPAPYTAPMAMTSDTLAQQGPTPHKNTANTPGPKDIAP